MLMQACEIDFFILLYNIIVMPMNFFLCFFYAVRIRRSYFSFRSKNFMVVISEYFNVLMLMKRNS